MSGNLTWGSAVLRPFVMLCFTRWDRCVLG
jgi:hypothetical protein